MFVFMMNRGYVISFIPTSPGALNRSLFAIGIDNTLPEEFARLYPRTVRTTRAALAGFESEYGVHLSDEESGLVAVIFGAR